MEEGITIRQWGSSQGIIKGEDRRVTWNTIQQEIRLAEQWGLPPRPVADGNLSW